MPGMEDAHAIVVGIANYANINPLPATVLQDARDIQSVLLDPAHCAYPEANVRLLLDGQATKAAILAVLAGLAARTTDGSSVFFYISSHGGQVAAGEAAGEYLLPVDTVSTSARSLAESAISGAEFTAALRAIKAGKVVVVFDCCHAGGIGQPKDATAPVLQIGIPERYYDELKQGRGRVILASSRSSELSWVMPGAANSLFTLHLLAGLRGGATGAGGVVRIFDLYSYLQPRVTADQPAQHPQFKAEIEENFPIALYLGGTAPAPAAAAPPADGFAHDAFLSYRDQEPDRGWVRKTLLPRLKAAGLRVCVDYECFPLGAPLLKAMADAVEKSRYSIAILSPAYLESNFNDFEATMAQYLGAEKSQNRLLLVRREDCQPRLDLRARYALDMTDNDEFELGLARLVEQLRQSPDA